MSCSRWHRLIALEVGGDLESRHSRRLEDHIEGCAACRELAVELRSQREDLLRLDREAADGVTLGSVRHAVMADLAERRRPLFPLPVGGVRLLVAGAAMVILVVAAVVLRQGRVPPQPRVAERSIPTSVPAPTTAPAPSPSNTEIAEPSLEVPPPAPLETVDRPPLQLARGDLPARGHEMPPSLSAPTEPMTIKILTDDPEVVIYWIVDPKGEKENA